MNGVSNNKVHRLGVIGDVHAEDERLETTLELLDAEDVDAIVCTGDVVDGTGSPDRAAGLLQRAGAMSVRGNHDRWLLEDRARHVTDAHRADELENSTLSFLRALPRERRIETIDGPLLLCHGVGSADLRKVWPGSTRMPPERSRELDALLSEGEYRYLLNGHMHFRVVVHFSTLTMVNAGTLRGDHSPGFMVLDFDKRHSEPFTFGEHGIERIKPVSLVPGTDHRIWRDTQEFNGAWEPTRLF